jgi:23S rRNA-/tRNA-specific pseudouridylate synthase
MKANKRRQRRLVSCAMLMSRLIFSLAFHPSLISTAGAFCFVRHSIRHHHHATSSSSRVFHPVKWAGQRSVIVTDTTSRNSGLSQQYADVTDDLLVVSGNLTVLKYCDHGYNNTSDEDGHHHHQQRQQPLSYAVIDKPPSVLCHHSEWAGSRSGGSQQKVLQVPMLQRIRQAFGGRRVNLVHRLDRGCSGCLLVSFAQAAADDSATRDTTSTTTTTAAESSMIDIANSINVGNDDRDDEEEESLSASYYTTVTRRLIQAMNHSRSQKTYIALVRGEGILHGRDFKQEGWFKVDRPIKNENGVLRNATTWFRFVAGQPCVVLLQDDDNNQQQQQPRASLVLARPETGRWHQIRRHLNGLSHPILGDSTHGSSKINRAFRTLYDMPPERTCLHLARLQLCLDDSDNDNHDHAASSGHELAVSSAASLYGIDVTCPLAPDMMRMLQDHMPNLLREARPILEEEGLVGILDDNTPHKDAFKVLPYTVTVQAASSMRM